MGQRGNLGLRFVQIPADRSLAINERISKVDSIRLSCDAAYFIPALLRDGPTGFNVASAQNMILPFPTFNECLKDNVPLFFFKRSESRDKQENVRAKQLLDLFSDKLAKRQNTFYGDVLVFWRRNVDEIRHQMKLTDFTLADVCRLLGASAVTGSPGVPGSLDVTLINGEPSKYQLDSIDSPDGVKEFHEEERDVSVESDWVGAMKVKKTPQKGPYMSREDLKEIDRGSISPETTRVEGDFNECPNTERTLQQQAKMPDSNIESEAGGGGGPLVIDEDPFLLVRSFVEDLQQQIPTILSTIQKLQCSSKDGTGDRIYRNRLLEAQADEQRRYSATALRLSTDLAQVSVLNNQLTRDNEIVRQELTTSQVQSRGYLEETRRLAEELSQLREENLQLRRGTALLKEELLLSKQQQRLSNNHHRSTDSVLGSCAQNINSDSLNVVSSSPTLVKGSSLLKGAFLQQSKENTAGVLAASSNFKQTTNGGTQTPANSLLSQFNSSILGGVNTTSAEIDLLLPNSSYLGGATTNNKGVLFSQAAIAPPGGISRTEKDASSAIDQQYIVTQSYKPSDYSTTDQFAQLTESEVVTIVRDDPSGWWWVTNGTPSGSGWFPFSFLERTIQR